MEEEPSEDVVWSNTVDQGQFLCAVVRTDHYTGQLLVTVTATGELLLEEEVGLAFDALFGPDMDDVVGWEGAALGTIDRWLDEQKRERKD